MRKNKSLLFASLISFFAGGSIFFVSFMLNLSSFTSFSSNLKIILPLRFTSYCLVAFSVIFFVVFFLLKNTVKSKKICIYLLVVELISIVISISVPLFNFSSYEYGYDMFEENHSIDKRYNEYFPYYDKMTELNNGNEDVIYLYEEYNIFGTTYIHIQNTMDLGYTAPLYDIEFFRTNDKLLLLQFNSEKTSFDENVYIQNYNGIDYQLSKNSNSYEIRINNDNMLYLFYVSDFDYVSNDLADLINKAVDEYMFLN